MASWAGSLVAIDAGVEPVMQLTCRDRNRMALQSDLLGAAALGIPNVLLLTGDHPRFGDHPDAQAVSSTSTQSSWCGRRARCATREVCSPGGALEPAPEWLHRRGRESVRPAGGFRAERLGKKVAAGAEFVQTQYVFDVAAFARGWRQVRDWA